MTVTADDSLRADLRRIDPAVSLESLPEEKVLLILDRTMDDPVTAGRPLLTRYAKPIALAAAAVAGFVILGFVNPGFVVHGESPQPVVERVRGGDRVQGKCVPPTAQELRKADVAVEGTVRSIKAGVVSLTVSQVWAGPQADVLEVAQSDGASESTEFALGKTYFVAAQDGAVWRCGYTGLESPELRTLYGEAF